MKLKRMLAAGVITLMLPLSAAAAPILSYGSLDDGELADIWMVQSLGGFFSASTVPSFNHLGTELDTQLFLIASDGTGIVANDDHLSLNSYVQANLAPGMYRLAVSMYGNDPQSDTGFIFRSPLGFGTAYGNGEVFNGTFSGIPAGYPYNGSYTLMTEGAESVIPNPEPATLLLMGTGLVGAASRKWRRRRPAVPRS